MSKSTNIVMFVLGAAVGSAATWYFTKKKYEQIAQEEIDSVKEAFSVPKHEDPLPQTREEVEQIEKAVVAKEKPSVMEYAAILNAQRYDTRTVEEDEEEEVPEPIDDFSERAKATPFIIPPERFGEYDDYQQISLTYWADSVLTDDADMIIHNVEDIVGFESLNHFGDYEDDSVHVRNDRLKCDYEILKDLRTYTEFLEENPHKAEM